MDENREETICSEEQKEMSESEGPMIEMNLEIGVYDVQNPDFNEKDFKPSSLPPVLLVDDDSSSSSDSESSDSETTLKMREI